MYDALLTSKCDIYRMTGVGGYNFSVSSEGEVDESWLLVASNVLFRLDRFSSPQTRRTDGLIILANPKGYFLATANIQQRDRIHITDGPIADFIGGYYSVYELTPIEGYDDFHHIEVTLVFMDREP